jgi:hypothetical protein
LPTRICFFMDESGGDGLNLAEKLHGARWKPGKPSPGQTRAKALRRRGQRKLKVVFLKARAVGVSRPSRENLAKWIRGQYPSKTSKPEPLTESRSLLATYVVFLKLQGPSSIRWAPAPSGVVGRVLRKRHRSELWAWAQRLYF